MKKHILLISTFILSFILLVGNVNADCVELTCIYPEGTVQSAVKIVQTKKCKLLTYRSTEVRDIYSSLWTEFDSDKFSNKDKNSSRYWDNESDSLIACPKCLNYHSVSGNIEVRDKNEDSCKTGYTELKEEAKEGLTNEELIEQNKKTVEEKMKDYQMNYCKYTLKEDKSNVNSEATTESNKISVELYYNNEKFRFNGTAQFTIEDVLQSRNGSCPLYLYSYYSNTGEKFWIKNSGKSGNRTYTLTDNQYLNNSGGNGGQSPDAPNNPCELFDEETIEIIDKIMNIIRIMVPILLIILGITDFFRATFNNSEDNMKKDRDRFIKRIIAAIVVFLVPMFVHLVLTLANSVWSDINPDTCIK